MFQNQLYVPWVRSSELVGLWFKVLETQVSWQHLKTYLGCHFSVSIFTSKGDRCYNPVAHEAWLCTQGFSLPVTSTLLTSYYLSASLTCHGLSAGFLPFTVQCLCCVWCGSAFVSLEGLMLLRQGYMKRPRDVQIKRKASQRSSTQQGWAPWPESGVWADLTWEITVKKGVDSPSFFFSPNRLISRTRIRLVENYQLGWHQKCFLFICGTQVSRNKDVLGLVMLRKS